MSSSRNPSLLFVERLAVNYGMLPIRLNVIRGNPSSARAVAQLER